MTDYTLHCHHFEDQIIARDAIIAHQAKVIKAERTAKNVYRALLGRAIIMRDHHRRTREQYQLWVREGRLVLKGEEQCET